MSAVTFLYTLVLQFLYCLMVIPVLCILFSLFGGQDQKIPWDCLVMFTVLLIIAVLLHKARSWASSTHIKGAQ